MRRFVTLLGLLGWAALTGCSRAEAGSFYEDAATGGGSGITGSGATVVGTDGSAGTSAGITLTFPGSMQDGDLMLIFDVTRNGTPPSTPTGWDVVYQVDTATNEYVSVWSRVASSEGSDITLTATSTGTFGHAAGLIVLRGVTAVSRSVFIDNATYAPPGGTPGGEYALTGYLSCFEGGSGLTGLTGLASEVVDVSNNDVALVIWGYDADYKGAGFGSSADDPYNSAGRSFSLFLE